MQNAPPPAAEQQPSLERRLATLMMADVAGYSRMMGKAEERTVQMLRGHREVFDALLAAHRGRIFNTAGDAILAEFPSAVEAVRCATEIQSALRTRNEKYPEEERMWFRIGINLGDVIVQGTDLLGDGVNVAARIQTIAEPGGVCISGSVYDQIQNKLTLQFRQLGERSFKNIAQPIRTFSIAEADGAAMPATPPAPKSAGQGKKVFAIVTGLCLLVVLAGLGSWLYRDHQARRAEEMRQAIEVERQTAETQRLAVEAEKTRAEQEHIAQERAEQEQRAATAAPSAATARQAVTPASAPAKAPPDKVPAPDRHDGSYAGQLCNERSARQSDRRCWPVQLQVAQGKISATWPVVRLGKTGQARGTVSENGAVAITLDGWTQNDTPTSASLTGKWENTRIYATGRWQGGREITGEWQRKE